MSEKLVIWRLSDGIRGHDNQSLGLIEALARHTPVHSLELAVPGQAWKMFWRALTGRRPPDVPKPKLVIAAGHATHLPLIALARSCRARSIVLMKPSLPVTFFNDCLIPAHDNVAAADNVLHTRGALNRIRPGLNRRCELGLMLIGGPSKHHAWDLESLIDQIRALVTATPDTHWHLGGSRRTPQDTVQRLRSLADLEVHEFATTPADWLPAMLADCGQVWVSADSVSMAYEAGTSGAATGILEVPVKAAGSRVERALQQLLDSGLAINFTDWRAGRPLTAPTEPLREADHSAGWILQRMQLAERRGST